MRISLRAPRGVLPVLAARVGEWWTNEPSEVESVCATKPKADARSVQGRLEELSKFAEAYEEFVEILCDSAQFGIKPSYELRYELARQTAVDRYGPLRSFLAAFLPPDDRDAFRFESGRPSDCFEKLFAAQNLQEFQRSDDGEMIFRIMKTREALHLYGEHLRLLATRVA